MRENTIGLSAQKIAGKLSNALIAVQNKAKIANSNIVVLSELLRDYSAHPESTEDGRAHLLKRFQFVHQIYLNQNFARKH
jgi:hypothetical protein